MTQQHTILARIAKLLALSEHNPSEAEAAAAAIKVQELLQEHGLSLAQVEAVGGATDSATTAREKVTIDRRAMFAWSRTLMAALAENNFCLHMVIKSRNAKALYSGGRGLTSRSHLLVGRRINVEVTQQTYDYLVEACRRQAVDMGITPKETREWNLFLEGAVSHLGERLSEQRRLRERESARAATSPGAANGTHRELVLSDVYGTEADLNNDTYNGFPPGTTAARRRDADAKRIARAAEEARLVAEGVDPTVAFYRSYGYGEAEANLHAANWNKRSARRGGRGRSQNWTRADENHARKINSVSYKAGRVAGGKIGLDTQVGTSTTKQIG